VLPRATALLAAQHADAKRATGQLQVLIVQVNTADPAKSPRMSAKRAEPDPT
jgi:hypothetical protein